MSTRLLKETRDLLPVFAGAVLFIILPYAIWQRQAEGFGLLAFAVGCAILGGASFGNELQHRTLLLLLAQPVPRSTLWREKMLVLGMGIAATTSVVWASLQLFWPPGTSAGELWPLLALIPLCAFCGTPCFTLLTGSGIAGAVFALTMPAGLAALGGLVADRMVLPGEWSFYTVWCIIGLLIVYCAGTYAVGYLSFKRYQVAEITHRDLVLPAAMESSLARCFSRAGMALGGPFGSLIKKELRLQQTSFLTAGLLWLVAAGGACFYFNRPDWAGAIVSIDFAIYVVLIPLLVGSLGVAEERTLGVTDWHFTLPPSAPRQWSAKLLVLFTTSLILGFLIPSLLYFVGRAVLGVESPPGGTETLLTYAMRALTLVIWQVFVTGVAIYAGSFCSGTLRAMLFSCVMLPVLVGWIWLVPGLAVAISRAELTSIVALLLPLFMLGVTQWFAWSNFRRRGRSARAIAGQVAVIALGGSTLLFLAICTLLLFKGQPLNTSDIWPG